MLSADEASDRRQDRMCTRLDPDETWMRFVHTGYFDAAAGPACLYCNPVTASTPGSSRSSNRSKKKKAEKLRTGKDCKRFFCVPCKLGGLCAHEFDSEGAPHFEHPRLKIYRTSYENSVRQTDLADFLDTSVVMGIRSNEHTVHHLSTRKVTTAAANVLYCEGCRENVANAKSEQNRTDNIHRGAILCSIECLLVYRHRLLNPPPVIPEDGNRRKQEAPHRSPMQ